MVWLLTLSAATVACAIPHKVTWSEAVETCIVRASGRQHFVMRKELELWTNIQGVLRRFAKRAIGCGFLGVSCEGCSRFGVRPSWRLLSLRLA